MIWLVICYIWCSLIKILWVSNYYEELALEWAMDKKLLTCFVTLYSSCFSNNSFLSAKIRFFLQLLVLPIKSIISKTEKAVMTAFSTQRFMSTSLTNATINFVLEVSCNVSWHIPICLYGNEYNLVHSQVLIVIYIDILPYIILLFINKYHDNSKSKDY